MTKNLAILGASGHGKVVADIAEMLGWKVVFFDDAYPAKSQNRHWKIIGRTCELIESLHHFGGIVVGIGDNLIRYQKTNLLIEKKASIATIIHPSAQVSQYAKIGLGSVVFANVVVNTDSAIGHSAILNTSCTVDHDCKLGNAVHICPGANIAGSVSVGDRSWVGIGASVKQGVEIGCDVMIGAGSVVLKTISNSQTVIGNPAKIYCPEK